jgi:hypothetical protein
VKGIGGDLAKSSCIQQGLWERKSRVEMKIVIERFVLYFLYYIILGPFALAGRLLGLDPFAGRGKGDTFWVEVPPDRDYCEVDGPEA